MTSVAYDITHALGGEWCGRHGLAPDIGHSAKDRGLKIWDAPDLPGGVGVHSFHGYDFRDVRDCLKNMGILSVDSGYKVDGAELERRRVEAKQRTRKIEERSKEIACNIWRRARPAKNTLAAGYLQSRAITLPPPPSLRFLPSHKHAKSGGRFPVLIAGVQSARGELIAIHRTYLKTKGPGKAGVTPNKAMLGPCRGGAVRFSKPQERIALAEGVETALSFMQETGVATWAALSTAGLKAANLPEIVRSVIIAADHDKNGAGKIAAYEAAERWAREGRTVEIVFPPDNHKDFNDALRAGVFS